MVSPAKLHKNEQRQKARRRRRLTQKIAEKAGLPPGTLLHVSDIKTEQVKVQVMTYDEHAFNECELANIEACEEPREGAVTWINVDGLTDLRVLEQLAKRFDIHPLVQEDILHANQRPKLDDYGKYVYIVFKMISLNGAGEIVTEQVSLILGDHYVISFQEDKAGDVFDIIRDRIRHYKGRLRRTGADYLAYALLDATVDHYFILLEALGEKIEQHEESLIAQPGQATIEDIHDLRSDLLLLRRSVWPLREVVGSLERGETALVRRPTMVYLRDLYDHTIQVIDTIETFRDILASMMDIYLSSVSNRMNEIMKVLTIIATIFIPLTFIVGVYGMNFKFMPELESRWGYPAVWALMILIAAGMLYYFKRKKWI